MIKPKKGFPKNSQLDVTDTIEYYILKFLGILLTYTIIIHIILNPI